MAKKAIQINDDDTRDGFVVCCGGWKFMEITHLIDAEIRVVLKVGRNSDVLFGDYKRKTSMLIMSTIMFVKLLCSLELPMPSQNEAT